MATISDVDIANSALIKIKANLITSFGDDGEEAAACNILYSQLRDDILRSHPWNFAIKQATLQQLSDDPAFEFNNAFQLPNDCLRVLKTDDMSFKYKIKGRELHTDAGSVKIEYIRQETDTTIFDPLFVEVLATRLASELAYPIAGSNETKGILLREYEKKMAEAKRRDGQEGIMDVVEANFWIDSRSQDWSFSN
jgi:hypothetical protein